jgi:aspartyl-tRNA(Asn)/glutamyl-tRNA(Gln) amidotransferase subunit A
LTTVFDVTGLPTLNDPAGLVDGKLPAGVQLVGRPFDEGSILSMAHIYEKYHGIGQTLVLPIIKESESE